MAKKIDPFDKFKAATLGRTNELIDAITPKRPEEPIPPQSLPPADKHQSIDEPPTPPMLAKVSKNADRELVSFHIAKDIKKKLGLLKYESERSFGELYSEAIEDLLKKYDKL